MEKAQTGVQKDKSRGARKGRECGMRPWGVES